MMHHYGRASVQAFPTLASYLVAKIHVFGIHKVLFAESAHTLEHIATDH
jgi:hypothetical protein